MKAWRLAVPALLVLLLPSASAASGTLALEAEGELRLTSVTEIGLQVAAGFTSAGDSLATMRLDCPDLKLTTYELRTLSTGQLDVTSGNSHQPYRRTHATLEISQALADGWMGLYPAEPAPSLTLTEVDHLTLHPASRSVLGNAPSTPEAAPRPERASFATAVGAPHFVFNHSGGALFEGVLRLKLSGVVLDVRSDEGVESFDLRSSPPSPPAAPERVRRWAYLECAEGRLSLGAGDDLQVAATAAVIEGARALSTYAQEATLELVGSEGSALDQAITIEGDLSGELAPALRSGAVVTSGRLSGEVTAASIAIPVASPVASVLSMWPLALAVGAVLGGGAATYALWKRGGTRLSVDQLVDLANQSAELGHYGAALEWLDQALARVPNHPRILADRAFFLSQLGDTAGAIAGYEAAAAASQDGEAHLMLARLLVELGDPDAAADAVCSALGRSPQMVFEVLDDPTLDRLAGAPPVARAIERALRESDG